MRTLCVGEGIVDLISQRPATALSEVDSFVAHLGGVSLNVAVMAARGGARVALVGGVGDDRWGDWLMRRLAGENIDLEWFRLLRGTRTGVAFVTVDEHGEATYDLHDSGAATGAALEADLLSAVDGTDALCFGSNMLAGEAEARLTMAARERALELGHPIVFDPNVRPGRWDGNAARAGAASAECVRGAFLVKCNEEEARLMTGEDDAEAAARSLLAAGAQHAVITLGERGAILRGGGLRRDAAARPERVLSTIGAGDVFLGVLLGRLGVSDFYPAVLAAALPDAVEEATRACQRWGALE
ncbi:MAG: carbohydrate kinase family protein [Solirubrobacteraceae bacterium]